jgi:transposase
MCHRVLLDAVRHVVDNCVKWVNLARDFPPYRRVHVFARRWRVTGLLAELYDRLRDKVRQQEGRSPDPTVCHRGLAVVVGGGAHPAFNVQLGRREEGRWGQATSGTWSWTVSPPSTWSGRTTAMRAGWWTGRPRSGGSPFRSSNAPTTRRVRGAAARRGDLLVLGEGVDGADLLLRRGRLGDLTARAALGLVRRPTPICPAAA